MHVSSTRFPQQAAGLLAALVFAAVSTFANAADALLFRIFLKDGATLISYGEYARVGDRVVFSVPLGDVSGNPRLHLVGIPETAVDWEKTDAYATAVRAKRYAESRGEEDYAILTGHVTLALNDIASEPNAAKRLAMAREARRNLAAWPSANYGYKAAEIANLVSLFDDAIAEMEGSLGTQTFSLSLVATTQPPPPMDLLPAPDTRATMEMAYEAAMLTADPSERAVLLQALSADLQYASSAVPWAAGLRSRITSSLGAELKTSKAYASLMNSTMRAATSSAARADVKGLQDIIARALRTDEALGRKRPGEMASLLAALDSRLDEARRLRLAQDAWMLRVEALKEYRKAVSAPLERLSAFRKWLEQIRSLSGPDPRFLRPLEQRASLGHLELQRVTAPAEAQSVHGLIAAALHMSKQAAGLRRNAVLSNDIKTAWDASAAAAGAISLVDRAVDELQRLLTARPASQ